MPDDSQIGGALVTQRALSLSGPLAVAGAIKSSKATARGDGVGYSAGAGGTVTQITSKSTAVTLNKICGQITTHAANMNAAAEAGFSVTNSLVEANDVPVVAIKSGATANSYQISVDSVSNGAFSITLTNVSSGTLGEAIVINFVIIKGASA